MSKHVIVADFQCDICGIPGYVYTDESNYIPSGWFCDLEKGVAIPRCGNCSISRLNYHDAIWQAMTTPSEVK